MTNHPRSHGAKFKVGQVVVFCNTYYKVEKVCKRDVLLGNGVEGIVVGNGCIHIPLTHELLRPLTKKEAGR